MNTNHTPALLAAVTLVSFCFCFAVSAARPQCTASLRTMAGLSETPAEVGRHNPVTHDYGSLEKHYEYDLVQFSKPYTRKVGTFFRTAPVAAPRDPPAPSVTASASQEGGPSASASKGLPPPAAATAFSAAELAALSRQNVRQPYDPEGELEPGSECTVAACRCIIAPCSQTASSFPKPLLKRWGGVPRKCHPAVFATLARLPA